METKNQKEPRQPDYKGKMDVAAWANKDKNGKTYLSVKIANNVNLFKNEPKEKEEVVL